MQTVEMLDSVTEDLLDGKCICFRMCACGCGDLHALTLRTK